MKEQNSGSHRDLNPSRHSYAMKKKMHIQQGVQQTGMLCFDEHVQNLGQANTSQNLQELLYKCVVF